jgi:NAD(P)H-dependent FMN reductase
MFKVERGRMTTSTQADPSTGPAIDHDCPLRVAVLTGSVRGERLSRTLAGWAADRIEVTGAAADLIDLAEHRLPDDELLQPGGGPRSEIADRIEHADAFVVVTPEYNHSYPGSLKRAIDWHYDEWAFKPATVLSYGVQGGLLATEHLRGVFAELHVVTTRRVVGLRAPWDDVSDGRFMAPPGVDGAFDTALAELHWWAETLRTARRERPYQR